MEKGYTLPTIARLLGHSNMDSLKVYLGIEEEDAIADLLPQPQAQNSIYAFNLVERRQKTGVGVPEAKPRRAPVFAMPATIAGQPSAASAASVPARPQSPLALMAGSNRFCPSCMYTTG